MKYAYVLLSGKVKREIVSVCVDVVSSSDEEAVSNALRYYKDRNDYLKQILEVWDLNEDCMVCSMIF